MRLPVNRSTPSVQTNQNQLITRGRQLSSIHLPVLSAVASSFVRADSIGFDAFEYAENSLQTMDSTIDSSIKGDHPSERFLNWCSFQFFFFES